MQKNVEKRIAEKLHVSKTKADVIFNAVLDALKEEIKADDNLILRGFGTFKTTMQKERMGRNPATGESLKIPAKNVLRFKPSKSLKDLLN